MDQSTNSDTQRVMQDYTATVPCLRYVAVSEPGASKARNRGLAVTHGDIVAFIDDDCTVEPAWLERVAEVFARQPRASVVFGAVRAIPHDPRYAFVPCHDIPRERVLHGLWAVLHTGGMGASMYLRRCKVADADPFDTQLGPGPGPFSSAEDWEYAYRVLRSGGCVVKTPAIAIDHHGMRDYASGAVSQLFRTCAYSDGAAVMKMVRCRDWAAFILLVVMAAHYLAYIKPRNIILLRRPNGLAWIAMYLKGLVASFQLPVDRRRCVYGTPRWMGST